LGDRFTFRGLLKNRALNQRRKFPVYGASEPYLSGDDFSAKELTESNRSN
jgi:hypothetical protein